jgi:Flp pilus assembly protein TadD
LASDPDNPALAGILEGIDLDRGDFEAALALATRARQLVPPDFATAADVASILMSLGRFDEADGILIRAAGSGADLDNLAPVLADFWIRTKRFDDGRGFLDRAIAVSPRDRRIRLVRAALLRAAGDTAGAERDYRALLAGDPAGEDALEGLVGILTETGRTEEAATVSLAAAERQPRNQENSLRAVRDCEAKGDVEGSVRNMEAAELSGPVNATFELTLALKLYQLRRMEEMMTRLAEAKKLSAHEGNSSVTDSIDTLIGRMRRQAAAAPP